MAILRTLVRMVFIPLIPFKGIFPCITADVFGNDDDYEHDDGDDDDNDEDDDFYVMMIIQLMMMTMH